NVFRIDTFHQLTYPNTYFGFLSIVPRVGFRGTYYSATQELNPFLPMVVPPPLSSEFPLPDPQTALPNVATGPVFRTVFNAGAENSFKNSRERDEVQDRAFGRDGLRHDSQPDVNFSWVSSPNVNPDDILQFERVQLSSKLNPIAFP